MKLTSQPERPPISPTMNARSQPTHTYTHTHTHTHTHMAQSQPSHRWAVGPVPTREHHGLGHHLWRPGLLHRSQSPAETLHPLRCTACIMYVTYSVFSALQASHEHAKPGAKSRAAGGLFCCVRPATDETSATATSLELRELLAINCGV